MATTLIRLALALLMLHAAAAAAPLRDGPRRTANEPGRELAIPYSVQLHCHGSLSEGTGSMDKHYAEAQNAGVDVIWWTDHDWRINYLRHVSNFGFEAAREPLSLNEPWTPRTLAEATGFKSCDQDDIVGFIEHSADFTPAAAFEGSRSLLMTGRRTLSSFRRFSYIFGSKNQRWKRSIASAPVLQIAIRPEAVSANARPFVLIDLSTHPPNSELAQGLYQIQYYLDNSITAPYRSGPVWYVPLAYDLHQWRLYTLPVLDDARAGFPFLLDAADNSLQQIRIGIEARNNATGSAYFDALSMTWDAQGVALLAEQDRMLADLSSTRPSVTSHIGTEISYGYPHLTEYSPQLVLPDYDHLADISGLTDQNGFIVDEPAFEDFVARQVIVDAHARGGLIAWCHMFGPYSWNDEVNELVAYFLGNQAKGADLLEVGYRNREGYTLEQYKLVWDELTKNQLYLVGIGTSDSHGLGPPGHWLNDTNNFVTWIYADSTEKVDLLRGLRRGRAFFGDPGLFRFGSISLATDHAYDLGDIVVTDRSSVTVNITVENVAPDSIIRVIVNGDLARSYTADSTHFEASETLDVAYPLGSFLRLEIHDAGGCQRSTAPPCCSHGAAHEHAGHGSDTYRAAFCETAFSNPICFTPTVPTHGLPRERVQVDMGGVFSHTISNFTVADVALESNGLSDTLRISGDAADGRIVLDFSERATCAPSVALSGLTGDYSFADNLLTISGLTGAGDVAVSWPTGPDCNANAIPDACDIASGASADCNGDGVPDECAAPDLAITEQPVGATICAGDAVTFSLGTAGTAPLSIQWRLDGVPIDGATQASYSIAAAALAAAGTYDAVVTNPCGSVTTDAAVLSVQAAATAQAGADQSVCAGATSTLDGATTDAAASLWSTSGDGDFADPASAQTTYTPGAADVAAGAVTLTLTVDAIAPCSGGASDSLLLTIDAPPLVTLDPLDVDAPAGASAVFSISAAGTEPLAYQWRKAGLDLTDDTRISGATTPTLTISPIEFADAADYDCAVSGPCGMTHSAAAALRVAAPGCPNPQPACEQSDIFPPGAADCMIDLSDLGVVLANFEPGVFGKLRAHGDVFPPGVGDGQVDLSDLGQILADFGTDCR